MVYEVVDLRTGEVVATGTCLEKILKGLPEGLYEIRKDGEVIKFYSVIDESHRSWI